MQSRPGLNIDEKKNTSFNMLNVYFEYIWVCVYIHIYI